MLKVVSHLTQLLSLHVLAFRPKCSLNGHNLVRTTVLGPGDRQSLDTNLQRFMKEGRVLNPRDFSQLI